MRESAVGVLKAAVISWCSRAFWMAVVTAGVRSATLAPLATMRSVLALMAACVASLASVRLPADHTAVAASAALWLDRLPTGTLRVSASSLPALPAA